MIIKYSIPSGVMRINANEFFEAAKKSQIRRMLKQLRQDERAAKDCRPLIWDYLEAQVQEAHYKVAPKMEKRYKDIQKIVTDILGD